MDNQCTEFEERGVVFGPGENLVGILAEPKRGHAQRLGVLLLTPGMLHSAGPFRLQRQLANRLTQCGIPSLRFDLSGIGESLAIGSKHNSLGRAAQEISAAIDLLQAELKVTEIACFGLCSGADDAVYAAGKDDRIVGLFSLDGCGFPTPRFYWHRAKYYLPRVFSRRKWQAKLQGFFGQGAVPPSLQLGTDIREFPEREAAELQLGQLAERGVRMHFQYTGGVREYYNYSQQFFDMFPRLLSYSNITTRYEAKWDHVMFLCEHRRELTQLASQFFQSIAHQRPQDRARQAEESSILALPASNTSMPSQFA